MEEDYTGKAYVFATEVEAQDLCDRIYDHRKANIEPDNTAYWNTTIKWADPIERTDGKWLVPFCDFCGNPEGFEIQEGV